MKLMIGILLLAVSCSKYDGGELPQPAEGSFAISPQISNLKVNGFAEDKYGHIWIATSRGLNKYTVNEYHQFFSVSDSLGLPDNQINAVHSAQDGALWVTTFNGVARRSVGGGFTRVPVMDSSRNISLMMETPRGEMLFSNGTTLFRYDSDQEAIRPVIREFNSFGAHPSIIGRDGLIWNISGDGRMLNCYSPADFTLISSIPLPHVSYHLCDAGSGELWLSGMGSLSILDARTGQFKPLPAAIKAEKRITGGDIDMLFAPDERSVLLNVIGKGFFLYSRPRERVLFQGDADFPYDIPDNEIRSIYLDSAGNIWFGTTDRGFSVSYHDRGLFGSNKYLTGAFQGRNVTAVCPDHDGGLWISTLRDGLFRYSLKARSTERVVSAPPRVFMKRIPGDCACARPLA